MAFWPNTTSSGSHPRKPAPARCASAITSSISSLSGKTPCVFEAPAAILFATASITLSGVCDPPGASAQTNGRPSAPTRASAGKRARTAVTSKVVAV